MNNTDNLKILIAGLSHCGSTRLYNVLRILFEKLNYNITCGWVKRETNVVKNNNKNVYITKAHWNFNSKDEHKYDKIILPYRDARDIAVSAIKRGFVTNSDVESYLDAQCGMFLYHSSIATNSCLIKYEDYSLEQLIKICNYLGVNVEDSCLLNIMLEVDKLYNSEDIVRRDNWDNENFRITLLSKHHNTDNGKSAKYLTFFSQLENETFLKNENIFNFLKKYGYIS